MGLCVVSGDDLECAPRLTGCGTQHPHRALGGTCVLLAAAPTTPPCFRRWRWSSSLLRMNSGKNIYNFGIAERLRALRYPIFTGRVTPSGANAPAPPRGSLWALPETLSLPLKGVPLGELASVARLRGCPGKGLNSLSQSLTALPAPSGREPLTRPETLHFSRKLCRHAKGPISEGAVAVGDWGSSLPGAAPEG